MSLNDAAFTVTAASPAPGVLLLRATGALDLASRDEFGSAVLEALRNHAGLVAVDLNGLSFIDSTGISALLATSRIAGARRHRLRLILDPDSRIAHLLDGLGVTALLSPAASLSTLLVEEGCQAPGGGAD